MKTNLGTYSVDDGFDKLSMLAEAKKQNPHMSLAELMRHLAKKNVKNLDK